jgi:hypothetical protein
LDISRVTFSLVAGQKIIEEDGDNYGSEGMVVNSLGWELSGVKK